MKRNCFALLLAALLLLAVLAGCGAASADASAAAEEAPAQAPEYDYSMGVNGYAATQETAVYEGEDWLYDDEWDVEEELAEEDTPRSGGTELAEAVTEGTVDLSQKIIYSAYAEIETTEYDESLETVYRLMDRYGAFLESSAINGTNLNGGKDDMRSASLVLRVPREHYSALTGALDQIGNVTYLTSNAENITAQYTDVESRLSTYEVEEQRLLEILAEAKTVKDMLELESRISDIRYQKESLTAQLRTWDTQVSYSKVDLFLREVRLLTPEPEPEPETYWQQVGAGFMSSLRWMGRAAMTLFRIFVAALPGLIPLALIILILVLVIRRRTKKDAEARAKAAEIKARAEAEYAAEHRNGPDAQ